MNAPLLRLYGDLWTSILNQMDIASAIKLLLTGSKQLGAILARQLKNIVHQDSDPVLDFNAILRSCQSFPSVKSITILPNSSRSLTRYPILLDNVPSELRSLNLSFCTACNLFAGFDFASRTPSLTNLSLSGPSATNVPFSAFLLPSTLEALNLSPMNSSILIGPNDVAKIPKSLISLTLSLKWDNSEKMERYDWPLSLTSLHLRGTNSHVNLEYLPRTLTLLDLVEFPRFKTAYPHDSIFPWRVFFPRLSVLLLSPYVFHAFNFEILLRSIVASEAVENQQAKTFIASGFWNVDAISTSLETSNPPATTAYPLFTRIRLPSPFWFQDPTDLISQLQSLAPYIRNTEFVSMTTNASVLKHAGVSPSAEVFAVTAKDELPSTLTSLKARDLPISFVPPTLTSLKCNTLVAQLDEVHEMGYSGLFSRLTTLHLYSAQDGFPFELLPASITDLHIRIFNSENWDLIATSLVSLRNLSLTLEPLSPDSELAPIKSTVLDTLCLICVVELDTTATKPYMSEFFSSPSPLPPTITDLTISGHPVHASIFTILPPRLLSFKTQVEFIESNLIPFPQGATLTPSELIGSLPQCIRHLYLSGKGPQITSPECLRSLPRSLTSFSTFQLFRFTDVFDEEGVVNLFPPLMNCITFPSPVNFYTITGEKRSTLMPNIEQAK